VQGARNAAPKRLHPEPARASTATLAARAARRRRVQVPADQKHHKGGHCRLHRDTA
jgi:hypothetical protein